MRIEFVLCLFDTTLIHQSAMLVPPSLAGYLDAFRAVDKLHIQVSVQI